MNIKEKHIKSLWSRTKQRKRYIRVIEEVMDAYFFILRIDDTTKIGVNYGFDYLS